MTDIDWEIPKFPISKWADPVTLPHIIKNALTFVSDLKITNSQDVYVAGHSLGGVFLSSIKSTYAGYILLASLDVRFRDLLNGKKEVIDVDTRTLTVFAERNGGSLNLVKVSLV